MTNPVDLVADVDRRIAVAFTALTIARARFYLAPCGEIVTACETAEDAVNELLELRLALTRDASRIAPPLQAA